MALSQKTTVRSARIDLLRGWLMLLVIVGHIVLGSVHDNVIRYAIYAFHMPLFIALSGYLINPDKLRATPFVALLARYWWRVILPFGLAFSVYTGTLLVHAADEGRLSQGLLLSYLYTPYYHLWFVPTLVLWVFGFWLAARLAIPSKWLVLAFLPLTLLWASVANESLGAVVSVLLSKKVVYFFGFFLFGVWLRTASAHTLMRVVKSFKVLPAALVMLCATIYLMEIGATKSALKGSAWLVMNLSLITICIVWATARKNISKKTGGTAVSLLVSMGRVSLPIYLWHVLPMFLLKGWDIHESHPIMYYLVSVVGVAIILFFLLKFENRSRILNKVMYGV